MAPGFTKISERVLHQENWFTFLTAEFDGPAGERIERYVFRHPGAVGVVPVDGDDVVLVRQFRPAVEMEMLELPAGKLDVPGEEPADAARRELVEEAGLDAPEMVELTRFHNSAGFSDELTIVYLATKLIPAKPMAASVEERYLSVERVPLDQVVRLVADETITDAKTIIGLLAALRYLGF